MLNWFTTAQLSWIVRLIFDSPPFKQGDRVYVAPLKVEATVVRQQRCYDGPDTFWGNVELLYDDGVKGVSNSWQLKKLTKAK